MQYRKFQVGRTIIEFHNSWLGKETVSANGQVVSQKSSILGTHHHFTIMEDGHAARYVVTSKMGPLGNVLIDVRRNGEIMQEDVALPFGGPAGLPENKSKRIGRIRLREYELEEALEEFQKALDVDPQDAEIHFHMACAYSVLERRREGFECLKKAVANRLPDTESILEHDMLAFLRLSPAFEGFLESGFTNYHPDQLYDSDE